MATAFERALPSSTPILDGSVNGRQSEERLQQIEAEQTRLLYAQAPIAFVISVVNATILALFLRPEVPAPALLTWWMSLIGVYLTRLALVWRYRRAAPSVTQDRRWRTRFLIGAVSAGCAWGVSGILLFPAHSLPHQVFLTFVIGGMGIGAITSTAAVKQVYWGFILPLTLPLICRFFLQEGELFFAMGLLGLIFVAGVMAMATQFYQTIMESIALRFEKQDLLQSRNALQMSHGVLEDRVRERTVALQQEVRERTRSETHARAMLRAIPDIVFRIDREGLFLEYKAEHRSQLQFPATFFLGRRVADVLPADTAQQMLAAIAETLRTEEAQVFEYVLNSEGKTREYEARLAVCGTNEVVAIVRDITQRREVERLKEELVSTVSHELRTPLTSVRGFTELMLSRPFPPEKQRKFLLILQREAVRLTELINDFLDLRRMEAGQEVYHLAAVALEPLLQQSLEIFDNESGPHTFRLDVAETLPLVDADANRIHQVLVNLLSNAVKFSPGGGEVVIGAQTRERTVIVWVKDEGVGIPPETLAKVFDRFFRVDNQATRSVGGTGLGLALVKEIVTAHKGQVWAESAPGKGSTFSFTVPVAESVEGPSV